MQVEVKISNIVKQEDIQAVVNSANANLRLGSGVTGANPCKSVRLRLAPPVKLRT